MKLKESFMTSDIIDFFMSQPNGAQYVVLYQMLCLKTINTGGKLERLIGEVLIPFDVAKITRDLKWFSEDTVRVAMQLFQQFGLIYRDENGTLVMADHDSMVGSETDYAEKQRRFRGGKGPEPSRITDGDRNGTITGDNGGDSGGDNVPTDIEIRDRYRDKDKEKEMRENKYVTDSEESVRRTEDVRRVMEAWNGLGIGQITTVSAGTVRGKTLMARIRQNGVEKVIEAIQQIKKSSFLQGQNKTGWTITFDWFVKPNNFLKVLEGQYNDKEGADDAWANQHCIDFTKILKGVRDDRKEAEEAAAKRYSYDDA